MRLGKKKKEEVLQYFVRETSFDVPLPNQTSFIGIVFSYSHHQNFKKKVFIAHKEQKSLI